MKPEKTKSLFWKSFDHPNMVDRADPRNPMKGQKNGWLAKRGRLLKNWKNRYFVLNEKKLTYYSNAGEVTSKRGSVDLGDSTSLVLSKCEDNFIIYVKTPGRVLQIKSTEEKETKSWYDSLKAAITKRAQPKTSLTNKTNFPGEVLLSGFMGKSKVMGTEELSEEWLQHSTRWTTFTWRYFVLCAEELGEDETAFSVSYYTDETCRTQRGRLVIGTDATSAFQSTKVPWKNYAVEDLKFEPPIFLTLSCKDWRVVLCPRTDEDGVQWRTAFDTTIHCLKVQEADVLPCSTTAEMIWE
ncbi:PH domain-containing protein [Chloropicon primus]|uniref:PH domain-containing protein n=1 Tax=Chloropicon primus TaxID=1764295 RepID=A0A5B8MG69_9CHLO|nr:hypothetical protein A3770_02p19640 [Chloropicon primus]UPQ98655.1 PH domain-containing protein [Chloropicon primus]|eukprot:QDZ19446.1 hypothetical protein A3770_02p19640 [Chloropicon primus]